MGTGRLLESSVQPTQTASNSPKTNSLRFKLQDFFRSMEDARRILKAVPIAHKKRRGTQLTALGVLVYLCNNK